MIVFKNPGWWPKCTCEPAKACTDQAECDRAARCRSENHCARAADDLNAAFVRACEGPLGVEVRDAS